MVAQPHPTEHPPRAPQWRGRAAQPCLPAERQRQNPAEGGPGVEGHSIRFWTGNQTQEVSCPIPANRDCATERADIRELPWLPPTRKVPRKNQTTLCPSSRPREERHRLTAFIRAQPSTSRESGSTWMLITSTPTKSSDLFQPEEIKGSG